MSNCCRIHSSVTFSVKDFDYSAFLEEEKKHQQHYHLKGWEDETKKIMCEFYWFLDRIHSLRDGFVWFNLGQGRSIHTWRDLGWTMESLSRFCLNPILTSVVISDEKDGFKSKEKLVFTISKEKGLQLGSDLQ